MQKRKDYLYLWFCDHCGVPQTIPHYIIKTYMKLPGVDWVYCKNCKHENKIPIYLKKIAEDLT